MCPGGNRENLWCWELRQREYYKNPEATAKALRDGWLFTGDMARQDEDGFIYIVDRKKDVIITGGENVFPVEVEDFLHTHPAIKDVAAIGVPTSGLASWSRWSSMWCREKQ